MPIYEYECISCGHRMEAIQPITDPALTDCPACTKAELRRLVSAAGFRLKGSGWYATDFKDKPKAKLAEAETTRPAEGDKAAAANKKPDTPKQSTATE